MADEPGQTWASAASAEAWRRGADRRAEALSAATQRMLHLAHLRAGSRVLDLAAGTGEQSLLAAKRVGKSGSVLATDVAASMLELAGQAAREAGLGNVRARVVDASAIDLEPESFQAVVCRLGLMFLPDLRQALVGVYQVLEPGGHLAAIVWSRRERNPMLSVPDEIAQRMGWPVEPRLTVRRALSLGDPDALAAALRGAGFGEVVVEPVPAPRTFGSAAEAVTASRTDSPVWRELVGGVAAAEAERFWGDVEQAYRPFEGPTGCRLPGEVLVVAGTRPPAG